MKPPARIAFYDFDGTLVSSNIVTRYAFFARHLPSRARSLIKMARLVASIPAFLALDHFSRRMFNEVFFREYKGIGHEWLLGRSGELFARIVRPSIYSGTSALLREDRSRGFRLVLVTGELDFALGPVAACLGFDHVICNSLVFEEDVATGEVVPPLIAEEEKVRAMTRLCQELGAGMADCKAYSDSFSDLPMLEAVGWPAAVNPDRRLRKIATARGWPILDMRAAGDFPPAERVKKRKLAQRRQGAENCKD